MGTSTAHATSVGSWTPIPSTFTDLIRCTWWKSITSEKSKGEKRCPSDRKRKPPALGFMQSPKPTEPRFAARGSPGCGECSRRQGGLPANDFLTLPLPENGLLPASCPL